MKRRSPRRGDRDRHVTHISAYTTAQILHALHQTQCGHCSPRETYSAYKNA
ncbi:unnamed protein product [Bemisia tabaci]|uniref:Uncharacterized protein n=1 Tax=Bemisia tabaci TaxID=7038 RepID=A0A9P0A054_BEMTA|nr:unnamed protein product [Bemisia tabaci]